MTDTKTFLQALISQTQTFLISFEQMKLLADRIAADSSMATNTATSAQSLGRTDLSAADIDNFNSAVQLLETILNGTNAGVNTGGSVRLAFYKIV